MPPVVSQNWIVANLTLLRLRAAGAEVGRSGSARRTGADLSHRGIL